MNDKPTDLDEHRGLLAQKDTDARRLLADVEANERTLRQRRDALEAQLLAAPSKNWREAADKARYLLGLYAAMLGNGDTQRRTLVEAVLADFAQLDRTS